ncbi:hypothetical protein, partial [Escherichia coli]|uniref:hypothetical protein n=1 Tax=Escherichia coli TaxID=562 RepID=UPI00215A27BD
AEHAQAKRARKGIPAIVGNLAQESMDAEDAGLVIFDETGAHPLARQPKLHAARALVAWIAGHLPPR